MRDPLDIEDFNKRIYPSVISAERKASLTSHYHSQMVQKPVHNFEFGKDAS